MPTLYDEHILYDIHGLYDDPLGPGTGGGTGGGSLGVWAVNLYDMAESGILTPMPFKSLKANWVLNGPGSIEIDLNYQGAGPTYAQATPAKRIVKLTRNGTVVWGGYLNDLSVSSRAKTVQAQCDGWWWRMRRRFIDLNLFYANVPQTTIAWDIIDKIQNQSDGDLGFIDGTHIGTVISRIREYCGQDARPNAADEVEAFSLLDDGFDWEIDPVTRAFNTWSPQRKTDHSSTIVFNESNLMDLQWEDDGRDLVNVITGIGNTDCSPYIKDQIEVTVRGEYGLMQDILQSNGNKSNPDDVDAEAREELRARQHGTVTATASFYTPDGPDWGTYGIGDLVTVNSNNGFSVWSKIMRIVEIAVSLESPNLAFFEIGLSGAID